MAYISTYHLNDSAPPRELELARPDGSGWLDAGDTVDLVDHLPDGTVVVVPATITAQGDQQNPSLITVPAPRTGMYGNVVTEVRKTSAGVPPDGGLAETFSEDLVYPVEP